MICPNCDRPDCQRDAKIAAWHAAPFPHRQSEVGAFCSLVVSMKEADEDCRAHTVNWREMALAGVE